MLSKLISKLLRKPKTLEEELAEANRLFEKFLDLCEEKKEWQREKLYECYLCCSLVSSRQGHASWHVRLTLTGKETDGI